MFTCIFQNAKLNRHGQSVAKTTVAVESALLRAESDLADKKAELDAVNAQLRAKSKVLDVKLKAEKVPNVYSAFTVLLFQISLTKSLFHFLFSR